MITFTNKSVAGSITTGAGNVPVGESQLLLVGTSNGTIVKSLEIITGNESCYVEVIRTDGTEGSSPSENNIASKSYATIKIDMKANDYLVLWEGFFVIPRNHRLYVKADSVHCRAVASVVEMT